MRYLHGARTVLLHCLFMLWAEPYLAYGAGNFTELSFAIATDAADVLPLVPIPITLSLTNNTDHTIWACYAIAPNASKTKIHVQYEDSGYREFKTVDWPVATVSLQDSPFGPGHKEEVSGYLYFSQAGLVPGRDPNHILDHHLLPRPGLYTLKASLRSLDDKEVLESNVLTLHVREPSGVDALACRDLQKVKLPYFLLSTRGSSGRKPDLDFMASQQQFLTTHSSSQYTQYLEYTLGWTYTLQASQPRCERKADLAALGIALLEKAANRQDFFLADRSLARLFEMAVNDKRLEDARQYVQEMKSRFPGSRLTAAANAKMDAVLDDLRQQKDE